MAKKKNNTIYILMREPSLALLPLVFPSLASAKSWCESHFPFVREWHRSNHTCSSWANGVDKSWIYKSSIQPNISKRKARS